MENNISFPVSPISISKLMFDDDDVPDSNGNNNGILEPGEVAEILPLIKNMSSKELYSVSATLKSDDSFINVLNNISGNSGFIYSTQRYNIKSNTPTPIKPNDSDILPESFYVFEYYPASTFQEVNLNLDVECKLESVNGMKLKCTIPIVFNEGVTPPANIVELIPEDNSDIVDEDTVFRILFDQNVSVDSNKSLTIYDSYGSIIHNIKMNDSQIEVVDKTVKIGLNQKLQAGKSYYIILDKGAVMDLNGNEIDDLNSPVSWNFSIKNINPPVQIPLINIEEITDSSVKLIWDNVDFVDSYKVKSCDNGDISIDDIKENYTIIKNLESATNYQISVHAINENGHSESECVGFKTLCNPNWGDVKKYTNSMLLYAIVKIDGKRADENDKLGVFIDDECRGISDVIINNDTAFIAMNVQGESSGDLSFKIWDVSNCTEYDVFANYEYKSHGILGDKGDYIIIEPGICSLSASISGSNEVCEGDEAQLSINLNGVSPWEITYSTPDESHTVSADKSPYLINASKEGAYSIVKIKNKYCEEEYQSNTISLNINPSPKPSFDYLSEDLKVTLNNTSEDATGYTWKFGDNQMSTEESPVHTYSDEGNYSIELIAQNEKCGEKTIKKDIVIKVTDLIENKDQNISIYPVPTTGKFTVDLNQTSIKSGEIKIVNSAGQIILKSKIRENRNKYNFDFSNYPKGGYFINIILGETVKTEKIILK